MDNELKFKGSKMIVQLKAQSPHIHFQHQELGVTLRGSELKPKLDAFLKQKTGMVENKSLDYKVQIICREAPEIVTVGQMQSKKYEKEEAYSIFYGNTGGGKKKYQGVWSNPQLTIICFQNDLKKALENYIVEFFFVTNFGMMQDKGFGSYIPEGKSNLSKNTVKEWMREDYQRTYCWNMTYHGRQTEPNKRCIEQMTMIKAFYGIMKSGQSYGGYERSYLFEYMHKNPSKVKDSSNIRKNIDNEKAWMKQKGIAPIVIRSQFGCKHELNRQDANPHYVRAFLGLASVQTWGPQNISVSDPKGTIERISSPVLFKIIGNDIYFIIKDIPDKIYGYEFKFSGIGGKTGEITTPSKDSFTGNKFDTEKFMQSYVEYFNTNISEGKVKSKEFFKINTEGGKYQ